MAARSGPRAALALTLVAWSACKDDAPTTDPSSSQSASPSSVATADLDKRCLQLAKICGDQDKHVEKIVDECKQLARVQLDKGCVDKARAMYDCYERELCGKNDKIWTLSDLGVLAERRGTCVNERDAARDCSGR
jgi:hypothetical protein